MPHLDELLGAATIAAAGLCIATALEPVTIGAANADARVDRRAEHPSGNSHHERSLSDRRRRR